jgi:hypothetical protein
MIPRSKTGFWGSAGLLAMAAAIAAGAPPAATQPANPDAQIKALQDEVGQLRAEMKAMKEQQQKQAAAAAQAAHADREDKADSAALAREANRRSQMLDVSGLTAGYDDDRGFFIANEDKSFLMNPFLLFQARYIANVRQNQTATGSDNTQNGFEIHRLQLGFDGYAFSPDLTYRIFWQSSEKTGGDLENLMAWVQYRIHDTPWIIGGGQFKDPLSHEQLTADASLLAVERTFTDDILASGEAFSKGATIRYDDGGPIRGEAAFTSGFNNNNTTFQGFPTNPATFGIASRAEYKVFGNWKDYTHFTSQGNTADLLVFGGGIDWSEAGHTNAYRHALDVQYNPGPIGLYASYLGRYTSGNTAGRGGDTYDPSFTLQASYLFTDRWEGFGRYDYLHLDGREFAAGTDTNVQEFTLGANYYFHGQRAKFTADLSYFPKGTPMDDVVTNVLANPGHGELLFRAQFQLSL